MTSAMPYGNRWIPGKATGWVISVALVAIVLLTFGQTVRYQFVSYDDGDYVYENPNVTAGFTFRGIAWAFTHVHAANWHPITTLSHLLDCQLYGLQPWGHHLTNVSLHAVGAILLFLALRALTDSIWPSAFVAAVFATHPLRVESVAWVSERKDVLSGVFFMLTLLAYAHYARASRSSVGRYLTVVIVFGLGLMCKPTLVTLPFVLLLLDYWPLGRWQRVKSKEQRTRSQWSVVGSLFAEKIPLFVLSAVSCIVTLYAQKQALEAGLHSSFIERAGNAMVSYITYLAQIFYPIDLAVLYPYPESGLRLVPVAFSLLFLVIISLLFVRWRRKYPFLLVGWLWYLGMLVPMIGFIQVGLQSHADRYTYLSQIGLYILVTWGALELFGRWRWEYGAASITGTIIIAVLVGCSRAQTAYWQNSEMLWQRAIDVTSDNYVAFYNLGSVLLKDRQVDPAMVLFQKAIEIKPDYEKAYVDMGSALMLVEQTDEAIGYYQKALQIRPDLAEAWSNLGSALLKKGRVDEAIQSYRRAIAIKPDSADIEYNLGRAFASTPDWKNAIASYQASLKMRPGDAKTLNNLGVAFARSGKMDAAIEELREALRSNPNYPEAHYNLGGLLVDRGQTEEAVVHYKKVLRLKPDYAEARQRLLELGVTPSN
jgi:tetratricopeptide (TPR) repeat protein